MKILFLEEDVAAVAQYENALKNSFPLVESRVAKTENDYIRHVNHFFPDVIIAGTIHSKYNISSALKYINDQQLFTAFVFISHDKESELSHSLIKSGAVCFTMEYGLKNLSVVVDEAVKKKTVER